jgi:isopentenyl-diphosphate delta-isomerase type 1
MAEFLDIVDRNDRAIGRMTRDEAHSGSMKMHRKIHIFVFNSRGELFVQKRASTRKQNPNQWQASVAGHVSSGETYEQAAKRECREELGVDVEPKFVAKYIFHAVDEREFIAVLEAVHNGPFEIDPEEADEARFMRIGELLGESKKGRIKLTEHFERSIKEYLAAK